MGNNKPGPIPMPGLNLGTLDTVQCTCGCVFWDATHVLKHVPALLGKTGRDEYQTLVTFVCRNCGRAAPPPQQYDPNALKLSQERGADNDKSPH